MYTKNAQLESSLNHTDCIYRPGFPAGVQHKRCVMPCFYKLCHFMFLAEGGLTRKKRATQECKPTTTNLCLAVIKASTSGQPMRLFNSTFSGFNYFNYASTDEAIFELSQHLRLLSTFEEYKRRGITDVDDCIPNLTTLLCHLYLPACPRDPQPQSLCRDTLSSNSTCAGVVAQMNRDGHDLQWPPVQVNCQDETWFALNRTVDNGMCRNNLVPSSCGHPMQLHNLNAW